MYLSTLRRVGFSVYGSGFGLFFVDQMVAEYGGTVRVEDNDPRGAEFVIELPAAVTDSPTPV